MNKNLQTQFIRRQYMLSKDYEVYYYNDIGLKEVAAHSHDYYEFYFFVGGEVMIEIAGVQTRLSPGDVILIPPGIKHKPVILDKTVPYQRFILWISVEYCNSLLSLSTNYAYIMQHAITSKKYIYHFDLFAFKSLQSKILSCIEEMHSERFGKDAKIALSINDIILSLNRAAYEQANPGLTTREESVYQNIISYIDTHIDEDLSLDELANQFYVSKFYLSHVFKDQMGLSIHQYILKKRLTLSRDAILDNTEISEAYLKCGFKDYSSFFRAFKKEFGLSPKEYRDIHSAVSTSHSV